MLLEYRVGYVVLCLITVTFTHTHTHTRILTSAIGFTSLAPLPSQQNLDVYDLTKIQTLIVQERLFERLAHGRKCTVIMCSGKTEGGQCCEITNTLQLKYQYYSNIWKFQRFILFCVWKVLCVIFLQHSFIGQLVLES